MGKIFHIKVTYEEYKNMQRDNIKMRLTQSSFGNISDVLREGVENCFILTAQGIVSIMNPFKHAVSFKCFFKKMLLENDINLKKKNSSRSGHKMTHFQTNLISS